MVAYVLGGTVAFYLGIEQVRAIALDLSRYSAYGRQGKMAECA